jgi:F0F1-type ATP synthase membrane subunit c/vacuolar-type H+-ATPase subunit K
MRLIVGATHPAEHTCIMQRRWILRPLASGLAVGVAFLSDAARADDGASADTTEPSVRLHVKADTSVAIERVDTGEFVCMSPCDREVPSTALYRIGGRRPSESFILDGHGGTAKITVDPATSRGYWTGALTLAGAGALVGSGALALAIGYATQSPVPGADGALTDTSYSDTMIVGTVLLVAGLAAGIYGGATLASNLKSRVTGNVMKDPPARGSTQPLRTAAAGPAWPGAGPTFYVPILGGTF